MQGADVLPVCFLVKKLTIGIGVMNPKYSVLLCGHSVNEYILKIEEWLSQGIKVIWLGSNESCTTLKEKFNSFAKAFLLQCFTNTGGPKDIIVDGDDKRGTVTSLEKSCPLFNAAQYKVEHCSADEHMIIQASAGTGKTTVMIDRIMYLMHTVPDLHMYDIYMITFTVAATNQMNQRLQEVLQKRFQLTKRIKYLTWLEEQSCMHISTIHSFAYNMLRQVGIKDGFSSSIDIRTFNQERSDLVFSKLDEFFDKEKTIIDNFGMSLYKTKQVIDSFWRQFSIKGISHKDILEMDWGAADGLDSEPFHNTLKDIIPKLDDEYMEIKRSNNAVAIDDIMRDLQEVLYKDNISTIADADMKYLFIDEFQDSDLSQINVAVKFVEMAGTNLFVVGDVKQSIYRFRGANDEAFDLLVEALKDIGARDPKHFILVNNYRTAANLMNEMDQYFARWGREEKLKYDKPVVPFHQVEGKLLIETIKNPEKPKKDSNTEKGNNKPADNKTTVQKPEIADEIQKYAEEALEDLRKRIEEDGKEANEKTRVAMIVRTNSQLFELARRLKKCKIPAVVKREGSFYQCDAVRDFFAVVCSYMYPTEAKFLFAFLMSPFSSLSDQLDISKMESLNADNGALIGYLRPYLDETKYEHYRRQLRLRPIIAVLKDLVEELPIIDNVIAIFKRDNSEREWESDKLNSVAKSVAVQYQANLHKLIEILVASFGTTNASLYDIYCFLKLKIATDRDEEEPNVWSNDSYKTIICMTAHKSKGLEYDTVILPYTGKRVTDSEKTEILIDYKNKKVAWNCRVKGKSSKMRSTYYEELHKLEHENELKEETRVLYVAMTRAIRRLTILLPEEVKDNTWASLIKGN